MWTEKMIWGALPDGFRKIVDPRGDYFVVRQDRMGQIDATMCRDDSVYGEASGYRGRGALQSVRLSDGETALVRSYRHGGIFRALTGGWFFTWPPRPFRELAITEELRRRGVRTVEVYAACVRPVGGPIYRGWLVTRELRGASDLWTALQGDLVRRTGLTPVLRATADALRAIHRHGVYHADLNLKNILVRAEDGGVRGYVIDFDRAGLFLGRLPREMANRNLNRLLRSLRKLDPERRYLSAESWNEFLEYYHGAPDA